MMGGEGADAFAIDLDQLDDIIGDLEACESELERLTSDLEAQHSELQQQWEGLTATAQREAHLEWARGMTEMRASLSQMRSAARVAHGNYSLAVSTNLGMWEGLA